MGIEPVRASACRERREVDMRGEIGFAGVCQHILVAMRLDRLQRVADGGLQMAVVDEQASAAVGGDALGDRIHQRRARRRQLDDRALGRDGGIRWQQCRIGRCRQPP